MKFAEHLAAHITPEWRKQYVSYDHMKKMLYSAVEEAPSLEITDKYVVEAYYGRFDEMFFQYCDKELAKINIFFLEKLAEATRKFSNLESDLALITSGLKNEEQSLSRLGSILRRRIHSNTSQSSSMGHEPGKSSREVKLAFSEFYLSLVLLQNYQTLNFQAFRKIAKKHDKLTNSRSGSRWRQEKVDSSAFYNCKDVDVMVREVENIFTSDLEGGNRQKAMKRLRVPPLGDKTNLGTTFRTGLYLGSFVVLVLIAVWIALLTSSSKHPGSMWQPALQMYRPFFLIILFIFLLGINTYGWRASGVNHVLIFELDPRDHLSYDQLVEVASFLGVIWMMSVLSFMLAHHVSIPPFVHPICLLVFFVVFFLNPIPIFYFRARRWLLRVLVSANRYLHVLTSANRYLHVLMSTSRYLHALMKASRYFMQVLARVDECEQFCIATAPFHHVGFADFWVADQLNSLSIALLDLEFLVCFYISDINWIEKLSPKASKDPLGTVCSGVSYGIRPLVACLPAWFRFAQCLRRFRDTRLVVPHVLNAGKYATTFFVVLFSTLYRSYNVKHSRENVSNNVFFYLWMISAVINSFYALCWDLKMDWGLFDKSAGENTCLREEIVYSRKCFYYLAAVENVVLRFSWVLVVSVEKTGFVHKEIVNSIVASLEVFRRFVWNYFRLENEHLNNCGQFRAVRDISIVPLNSDDQKLIEKMMDDEMDFVTNRKYRTQQPLGKEPGDNVIIHL